MAKVTPSPPDEYANSKYPMPPLANDWEAFLWMQDQKGKGEVLTDPNAHWRIIDRNKGNNTTIYEFLRQAEESATPMLWGYVYNHSGLTGIVVKFLTHLSPGKQDLNYVQPCLKDLERKYHRKIYDYDIVDTHTPILESYKPIGTDLPGKAALPAQPAPQGYEHLTYENPYGELETVRTDILSSGTKISTIYLGKFAPAGNGPFETMVFPPDDEDLMYNSEAHYSDTEKEALNTHYALVDTYNKKSLEEAAEKRGMPPGFVDAQSKNKSMAQQIEELKELADKVYNKESSNDTHEPFMFYHNKLYFGRSHHADILTRMMQEEDVDWEELEDDPPLFGWLYKPKGGVRFTTDTGYESEDQGSKEKVIQLLRKKFNNPEITYDDGMNFSFNGWYNTPKWQEEDIHYDTLLPKDNPIPGQLPLFQSSAAFNAVELDPGDEANHSERERPFVYHIPSKTLFYTTDYCHHHHIMPLISSYLQTHGYPGEYEATMGPWLAGDITDPDWNHRNWIKFIDTKPGGYPESVIQFLQEKFGPDRDVMYSTEDGWDKLPEEAVDKEAAFIGDTPREDRLKEWRWSYDPSIEDLKVWEVNDGFPGHADVTGNEGMYHFAQGRVYLKKDGVETFYWKNRPMALAEPERVEVQDKGWDAIQKWITDNKVEEMVPDADTTT